MKMINVKMLAAGLIAIQIATTAMPVAALASENEDYAVTAQEQVEHDQDAATEEITESVETAATSAAAAETEQEEEEAAAETEKVTEVEAEEAEAETVEEPEVVTEEEIEDESADESEVVTEDGTETETTEENEVETEEETEAKTAEETGIDSTEGSADEMKQSEEQAQSDDQKKPYFEQSVTVDKVKVTVKAEEGTFEEGAKLSVTRVPSSQLKQVENAVTDARAEDRNAAAYAYAFDIKILSKDGIVLQPAEGKNVKVSFGTEEMADSSLKAVVYHVVEANNNITAKKLATAVNRNTKTAEARADGFSCYVVEFYKVGETNTNTNTDTKTDTDTNNKSNADTTTDEKTDTDTISKKDTDKPEKDPASEVKKDTESKTVTPAAKDNADSKKDSSAVKKEAKRETSETAVKKETKTDEQKTVKAKKEKKKETENKEKTKKKQSEKNKEKSTKKSPATGDNSNDMAIWLALSFLAAGGIIWGILSRKMKSDR